MNNSASPSVGGPTFDPLDPTLDADPHPKLRELREYDPVFVEEAAGMVIVTGYEEGKQVFRDPDGAHRYVEYQQMRQGPEIVDAPYVRGMSKWVLMQVGQDHRWMRATITKHFTLARVETLRPQMWSLAHDLIDGFAEQHEVEAVHVYGNQLPLEIISALLDVPREDTERIEAWMRGFTHAVEFLPMNEQELAETNDAITGLGDYFADLIEKRRAEPGEDLLSALVTEADAGQLSEEELVVNAWGLYAAGHETSGNAICDAIVALLEHPDQLELLRANPDLLMSATDECLRWDGPGQGTHRIFPTDRRFGEHTIAAGTPCVVYMSGANRDPQRFEDPDRFDITRPDAKEHLGFADGPHRCAGQHLARASIAVAIGALFQRLENVRIAGEVEWASRTVFHGPRALRLAWDSVNPRPQGV